MVEGEPSRVDHYIEELEDGVGGNARGGEADDLVLGDRAPLAKDEVRDLIHRPSVDGGGTFFEDGGH